MQSINVGVWISQSNVMWSYWETSDWGWVL